MSFSLRHIRMEQDVVNEGDEKYVVDVPCLLSCIIIISYGSG